MPRLVASVTLALAAGLLLSACGAEPASTTQEAPESRTVTITDNTGMQTIEVPPNSVVALDDRTVEMLKSWGVELSADGNSLLRSTAPSNDEDAAADSESETTAEGLDTSRPEQEREDIGPPEPDFEIISEVRPDLVIEGQQFAQYREEIADAAPGATLLDVNPRDGEPFDYELRRQVVVLGEIFQKQDEAADLVTEFDAAIDRVKAAYDPEDTVLAVIISDGEVGHSAAGNGHTFGPLFDVLDLTPALEVERSSENEAGDTLGSDELAAAHPDWLFVMDRDAAGAPTSEPLPNSEVLADVTAMQQGQIVYMPTGAYTNLGIQSYTEFLNSFADALEAQE
ncbi:MAG: ABC transporter substrate-binding protein [Leucobacter sp.]